MKDRFYEETKRRALLHDAKELSERLKILVDPYHIRWDDKEQAYIWYDRAGRFWWRLDAKTREWTWLDVGAYRRLQKQAEDLELSRQAARETEKPWLITPGLKPQRLKSP